MKEIKWAVGQTVWCLLHGKGTITDIDADDESDYSIAVGFHDGRNASYTVDGKFTTTSNRTLFFSEPEVKAELYPPKPPFVPTLNPGDMVTIMSKSGNMNTAHTIYVVKETEYVLISTTGTGYNKEFYDIYRLEKV